MGEINPVLALFLLLVGGTGASLFRRYRRRSAYRGLPLTVDWIEELSTERYRPMLRLLDPDELTFLRGQPGFEGGDEVRFRSERARIFRAYLHSLETDFERMSMAIRVLLVNSRDDRPDLARAMVRRQAAFTASMALVHMRLSLYRWGVCSVDTGGLMQSFEAVRTELRALLPATAPARA